MYSVGKASLRHLDASFLEGKYAGKRISRKDLEEQNDIMSGEEGEEGDEDGDESPSADYGQNEDLNEEIAERRMDNLFFDLEHFSDEEDEEDEEGEEGEEEEEEEEQEEEAEEKLAKAKARGSKIVCSSTYAVCFGAWCARACA